MHERLAEILESYHRRRALGEAPDPERYRERAGEDFPLFLRIVTAGEELDTRAEGTTAPRLPLTFGPYTLLRELGRGAVGVVYEAIHRGLGRIVALKILRTGLEIENVAMERFRREARACAQLNHDHIARVFEAGQVRGRPFYAMARIDGRTLAQAARGGELTDPLALAASAAGVADALHALHGRGILHRDIKPENVMVDPAGRFVLTDFGLARMIGTESLTRTGESLGTPLYMSPEQLLGQQERIDGRTDVYALGATLYEALAGRPMLAAIDARQLMREVLSTRPRPLHEVAPGIPRALSDVIGKAVEKRREDRYPDAAAMRDDLLACARGSGIRGRPITPMRRALRWVGLRWPAFAAAAALLVGGAAWWLGRPARLEVVSFPAAVVHLDGGAAGETPWAAELDAGRHELALSCEGFRRCSDTLRLRRGEMLSVRVVLVAQPVGNDEELRERARRLGLELGSLGPAEPVVRSRGAPPQALALFPRGRVGRRDLERFRLDVAEDFEGAGTLYFEAQGEVVYEEQFEPENTRTVAPIPAAVLAALEPGVEVVWGLRREGALLAAAAFSLEEDAGLDRRTADLRECLKDLDPESRAILQAQVLLDAGRFSGALSRLDGLLTREPALAAAQRALDALGLRGSRPWRDLQHRIADLRRTRGG